MYVLAPHYKIDKFQDGESILQKKDSKDIIILNKTATYILELILKYDIEKAKKIYITSFKQNQIPNMCKIDEDFDNIVKDYVIHEIISLR